jgi:hypothetical protein
MRMYPEVSGLAAWSENCKWHNSLPLGTVVSLLCESVEWVLPPQPFVLLPNECLMLLFISLLAQSGNFWIYPRIVYMAVNFITDVTFCVTKIRNLLYKWIWIIILQRTGYFHTKCIIFALLPILEYHRSPKFLLRQVTDSLNGKSDIIWSLPPKRRDRKTETNFHVSRDIGTCDIFTKAI